MASGFGEEEGNTEGVSWRLIGPATGLSEKRCRLMYSSLGRSSDVCLFYVKGEFFAMDARCAHSGNASIAKCLLSSIRPMLSFQLRRILRTANMSVFNSTSKKYTQIVIYFPLLL